MPDPDRRKGVFAVCLRRCLQGQALVLIQECHFRIGDDCPGGILHYSGDRSLIYLAKHTLGLQQKKEQASKSYVLAAFKPIHSLAINGHPNNPPFFGLRSWADEIGCADSIEVTGYILDRDEARPTQ
jgi:hypothetical protein